VSVPELSLVVCTRDRASRLPACLESIGRIVSDEDWELVVVDNGSTDDTQAVLERLRRELPVPLTVVSEPSPGVARARNRGWQAASAAIVAYTDDDCYPSPDLVDRICAAFRADSGLGFIGGSVVPHDPGESTVTTVMRPKPLEIHSGMFVAAGTLITANLAFRTKVLESIGGFDEVFAYNNGLTTDDVDAVARAAAAGWRGLYDPALVVRHHHGRRRAEDVERVKRSYDIGRGAFYAKCLLDTKLRRLYLKGWARLTVERIARRESLGPTLRELEGALRYFGLRLRGRA
jgi:glycosyltransferase involved in cell wall biosynthesis